jgi:FMN phosphatase YigB (HAD superfamily)
VLFDVGGVVLLPDRRQVSAALARADIKHDVTKIDAAHYRGVHAGDGVELAGERESYAKLARVGYVSSLGIAPRDLPHAASIVNELFLKPSCEVWTQIVPGAPEVLQELAAAELSVAIVSNADGTVETSLASLGICQVGPGSATAVGAIVDSTIVGMSKPDSRIFTYALSLLGAHAENTIFIGDSDWNDIQGASSAGILGVHVDPLGLCRRPEQHRHVQSVSELGSTLLKFGPR